MKLTAEELGEGETVILTLADRGILDEKGNLHEDDEELVLENVLAVSVGVWGGRGICICTHGVCLALVGGRSISGGLLHARACSASLLLWEMPSLLYF